ncbi:HD domain-containing protein [Irregularibacter muris]|uniref:HD domain-containing protein n=1 Tax=Irregularibacter muris TaxID=1796619 RepID=A0AAE3HG76_9FIRM|nr:HD domain-containing protein [Irregularibacter muris]MCR1898854.1 HD domain-containing protein [Irregularibacter muris]
MKFNIPSYVKNVIEKLEEKNYEAFVVGGSIRDLILGRAPSDFDVTTNARPEEIEEVFQEYKTLSVGKAFGTIIVVQKEGNLEVTTYRVEGEYLDGRRPSEVMFSNHLVEDLKRRDFTVNAMAYNANTGLVDPFQGREDLQEKRIKSVGNPKERFEEDHLRILRAVRFAVQLGFTIEVNTYRACKDMGYLLQKISMERIREELFKILLSEKPSYGLNLLKDLDLLKVILPELVDTIGFEQHNPHHDKDVFDHILCVVDHSPPILEVRLAALLHDIGKPDTFSQDKEGIGHFYGHDKVGAEKAKKILQRLKCPNELIYSVAILIREHMTQYANYKDKGLKRLIKRVGKDRIFQLITLQKSDRICSAGEIKMDVLTQREKEIRRILESAEAYEKSQLKINGKDLIQLGYVPGKIIGEILDDLLEQVIDHPQLNDKEKLLQIARKKFRKNS